MDERVYGRACTYSFNMTSQEDEHNIGGLIVWTNARADFRDTLARIDVMGHLTTDLSTLTMLGFDSANEELHSAHRIRGCDVARIMISRLYVSAT